MSDHEARLNPESFASPEEMRQARDPNVGAGTPETAPEEKPKTTIADRLRAIFR